MKQSTNCLSLRRLRCRSPIHKEPAMYHRKTEDTMNIHSNYFFKKIFFLYSPCIIQCSTLHICRLGRLWSALIPHCIERRSPRLGLSIFSVYLVLWLVHTQGGKRAPPPTGVLGRNSGIIRIQSFHGLTHCSFFLFSFFQRPLFSSFFSFNCFLHFFPRFLEGVCETGRSTVRNWRKFQSPDPEGRKVISKKIPILQPRFFPYLGRVERNTSGKKKKQSKI